MSTTDKIIDINALKEENAQLKNDLSRFDSAGPQWIVIQNRILENQRSINILLGNISLDIYVHIYTC